jgi:integrase
MAVRIVDRRGERRLFIDIRYRNPDGTRARYRHDAEVQNLQAARAEDRRRLALLATTGSPYGVLAPNGAPPVTEPREPGPEPEAPAAPLFRDVAKEYMTAYATSHLKPSTRFAYDQRLQGFFLNAIGDLPITQITPSKVRELDAELVDTGVKASTRAAYQIVLRSILGRFAVERGYLSERPAFPKLPRSGRTIHTALTPEELDRLFAAAPSASHRRAFLLAAYAGLRAGEIRALRWKDIDLRARTLTVRLSRCNGATSTPKSGHERLIPLAEILPRELSTPKTKKRAPDALVCLTAKGKPWGQTGLLHSFKRVCKRAGLEGWRLHDLRHFFVTSLFRTGAPAPAVQMLAGHADLSTTQRYAHTSRAELTAAVARLGATVGQQT